MATNRQGEAQTELSSTNSDILKREPSHDEAREAREFQEKRAAGGSDSEADVNQSTRTESTNDVAKGNRR